jgi:geranylgeranyl pyrophosphate synthase
MTIQDYLHREKELTSPLVTAFLDQQAKSYGGLTIEYGHLFQHLKTYLLRGGKWHRPALALLAYRVCGGTNIEAVRPRVAAIELMHRYLLVHDDVIDQDFTRHGGPTIEQIYKDEFLATFPEKHEGMFAKGNAIVAGDVINALTYELLCADLSEKQSSLAVHCFNQLLLETAAGWQVQTKQNFMAIDQVSEADFLTGMKLVSAQYSVVWPIRIGQILTDQFSTWNQQLDTYGFHTGMAFQITDDILGMFGDESVTGKPVGHDFREGKKTLLVLYAYAHGSAEDKSFIESKLGTDVSADEVETARAIFTKTGALDYSYSLAQDHVRQAKQALETFNTTDTEALGLLGSLADLFGKRDF